MYKINVKNIEQCLVEYKHSIVVNYYDSLKMSISMQNFDATLISTPKKQWASSPLPDVYTNKKHKLIIRQI